MTKKRYKKLFYSWIVENREYFEDLGEALKSVRKVGFKPDKPKANDSSYQRAWDFLNEPLMKKK